MGAGLRRFGRTFQDVQRTSAAGQQQNLTNLINLARTAAAVETAKAASLRARAAGKGKSGEERIKNLQGQASVWNNKLNSLLKERNQLLATVKNIRSVLDPAVEGTMNLTPQERKDLVTAQQKIPVLDRAIRVAQSRLIDISQKFGENIDEIRGVKPEDIGVVGTEETETTAAAPDAKEETRKKKAEERKAKTTKGRESRTGRIDPEIKAKIGSFIDALRGGREKREAARGQTGLEAGLFKTPTARLGRTGRLSEQLKTTGEEAISGDIATSPVDKALMDRLNRRIDQIEGRR